jgi:hypothetical protein
MGAHLGSSWPTSASTGGSTTRTTPSASPTAWCSPPWWCRGYGILQHYTGADWYRGLLGRRRYVRPRIEGAHGFAAVGFFRNYLTYAHMLVLPLGFALTAPARWIRLLGVPLITLALVFSTARGAWLAAVVMMLRPGGDRTRAC